MIREFYSFKNILAVDPGLDGTGWAVISEKTGHLLGCGLAKPFAQVNHTQSMCEIRKKLLHVWQERVGYSTNPMVLAVEIPQMAEHRFLKEDSSNVIPLSIMGGLIWASLVPNKCYMPQACKWKEQAPSKVLEARFLCDLDTKSKRVYAEDIHVVPRHLRGPVIDAIGLGQWAYRKWEKEQQVAVEA